MQMIDLGLDVWRNSRDIALLKSWTRVPETPALWKSKEWRGRLNDKELSPGR